MSRLLFLVTVVAVAGCVEATNPPKTRGTIGMDSRVYSFDFEGHEYVVYEGYHKGGICHSGSCPACNPPKAEAE